MPYFSKFLTDGAVRTPRGFPPRLGTFSTIAQVSLTGSDTELRWQFEPLPHLLSFLVQLGLVIQFVPLPFFCFPCRAVSDIARPAPFRMSRASQPPPSPAHPAPNASAPPAVSFTIELACFPGFFFLHNSLSICNRDSFFCQIFSVSSPNSSPTELPPFHLRNRLAQPQTIFLVWPRGLSFTFGQMFHPLGYSSVQ